MLKYAVQYQSHNDFFSVHLLAWLNMSYMNN